MKHAICSYDCKQGCHSTPKKNETPGKFTEYVLRVAGKPEIARYPGHDFFTVVMKARRTNRGEFRQLRCTGRKHTAGEWQKSACYARNDRLGLQGSD